MYTFTYWHTHKNTLTHTHKHTHTNKHTHTHTPALLQRKRREREGGGGEKDMGDKRMWERTHRLRKVHTCTACSSSTPYTLAAPHPHPTPQHTHIHMPTQTQDKHKVQALKWLSALPVSVQRCWLQTKTNGQCHVWWNHTGSLSQVIRLIPWIFGWNFLLAIIKTNPNPNSTKSLTRNPTLNP